MSLVLASILLGELEFEFVDSKARAFSLAFHRNGAQQSYSRKAVRVLSRFHAARILARPLSYNNNDDTHLLCCVHAGLTNSSKAVILLGQLPKIDKAIYFSNGKMSPQIRK